MGLGNLQVEKHNYYMLQGKHDCALNCLSVIINDSNTFNMQTEYTVCAWDSCYKNNIVEAHYYVIRLEMGNS